MAYNHTPNGPSGRSLSKTGSTDIPVISPFFNQYVRPVLSRWGIDARISSRRKYFPRAEISETLNLDGSYPDGAVISVHVDFQIRTAFNNLMRGERPYKPWSIKLEIAPVGTYFYLDHENVKNKEDPIFSISRRAQEAVMHTINSDRSFAYAVGLLWKWQKPETTIEELLQDVVSSRPDSNRHQMDQVMEVLAELGPLIPNIKKNDYIVKYEQPELLQRLHDEHAPMIEEIRRKKEVNDRLAELTYVDRSAIIPQQQGRLVRGLFASQALPKDTWMGDYLGSPYDPTHHDDETYVFYESGFAKSNKSGVIGETRLKYSNDAPEEAMKHPLTGEPIKAANMYVKGNSFHLARDVQAGEELTWPYREGPGWMPYGPNGKKLEASQLNHNPAAAPGARP